MHPISVADGACAPWRGRHALLMALRAADADLVRTAWSAHADNSQQFFLKLTKERVP